MRGAAALLVAAWSVTATAAEPMVVDVGCLPELRPWGPPPPPLDPEGAEVESTMIGTVVTKDFLQKIPTGRSYQDAVRLSAGTGGGASNGYALDSATSPVPPPLGVPIHGDAQRWGGVVHLSNDDGGSLASAQRLLDRLERHAGVDPAQVRPHELMNWLPFPATAPVAGATFAVRPSAFLDGGRLGLALTVQAAHPDRPPLDLTLVIDRSGSMSAPERMPLVHRALERLGAALQPGDTVDVVLFDHSVCTAVKDFAVGRDDPRLWSTMVAGIQPRGSTDLNAGLQEGYARAREAPVDPARLRRVLLFTDALLNTGVTDVALVTEVGRAFDERGVRLTAAGLGDDFRDDVLWSLTEKGRGAYVFLGRQDVVDRMFGEEADRLLQAVAEDVRFSLHLPPSLGLRRFFGEEASFDPADVKKVHLGAGERQTFLQELELRDGRYDDVVAFEIRWIDPTTGDERTATSSWTVRELLRSDADTARDALAAVTWAELVRSAAAGGDGCRGPFTAWRRDAADRPALRALERALDGWCAATGHAAIRRPARRGWVATHGTPAAPLRGTDAPTLFAMRSWAPLRVDCPGVRLPGPWAADPGPGLCPATVEGTLTSVPIPVAGTLRCVPGWGPSDWCF